MVTRILPPLLLLALGASPIAAQTITGLQPSGYAVAPLAVGATQYIDRTYTITTVPASLAGGQLIKTANGDKNLTSAVHITFQISASARVYVAYDSRASARPAWMGTFVASGVSLGTTDVALTVFEKDFPAGTVALGGNLQSPGDAQTHYAVVVVSLAPPPPPVACNDGVDNDGDGLIDFPADPGCASATDADETDAPPLPPTPGPVTLCCTHWHLFWTDQATNEDWYEVERAPAAGGPWAWLATIPANSERYDDGNVVLGTVYCYRVRAVNAAGPGGYSNVECSPP